MCSQTKLRRCVRWDFDADTFNEDRNAVKWVNLDPDFNELSIHLKVIHIKRFRCSGVDWATDSNGFAIFEFHKPQFSHVPTMLNRRPIARRVGGPEGRVENRMENRASGRTCVGENNSRRWSVVVWHVRLVPTIGGDFKLSLRNFARLSGSGMKRSDQNNRSKCHPIEPPTAYTESLI